MRSFMFSFHKYFDTLDGGAGNGAPAGDPNGAAATVPTSGAGITPPSGAATAGAGQPGGGAGGGEQRPTYSFPEDRKDWVPPHRMRETTQRVDQLQRTLENQQQRIRALMGVAEPPDPRQAELTNAMKQMFPGLAPFIDNPKLHEQLVNGQFPGRESIDGFQSAYWTRHATETVNEAVTEFAKASGIDPSKLPEGAARHMARQLQGFIGNDPERRAAYESRDPGFMRAFIADLTGFFVNPFRQASAVQGAQQVQTNRQLPSTRGAAGVPSASGGAPQRPTGKALHEAARQALVAQIGS